MPKKEKDKTDKAGPPCLSKKQIDMARVIADRHKLDIPWDVLIDFDFGKKFIDLFAYDPDNNDLTGYRRIEIIEKYLYTDKNQKHLQFKLELSQEDVAFMVMVLAEYRYGGALPREDLSDPDPEGTSFKKLEEEIYKSAL